MKNTRLTISVIYESRNFNLMIYLPILHKRSE